MSKKEQLLSAEHLRAVLKYDPLTGIFIWCDCPWPRRHNGKQAGAPRGARGNYIRIAIDGTRYYAHRLAWLYMTGEWPEGQLDHADGDVQNNAWHNLRIASPSQNAANRRPADRPLPKGVTEMTRGYLASITVDYQSIKLGCFKTPAEAHAVYAATAQKFFGPFARPR